MSIDIGRYTFDGPYTNTNSLEDRSGVYAILCSSDQNYSLIDVGESATVKTRVESHDRKDCWTRYCYKTLSVAVYYTPHLQQTGRMEIEQEIRKEFNPPCGQR